MLDGKVHWDRAGLMTRTPQPVLPEDSLAAWERIDVGLPNSPIKLPKPIPDVLPIPREKRTDVQKTALRDYFVRFVYRNVRETFDPLNKEFDELKGAEEKLDKAIPSTMVMAEMAKRREKLKLSPNDVLTGCPLCNGDPIAPGKRAAATTGGGAQ